MWAGKLLVAYIVAIRVIPSATHSSEIPRIIKLLPTWIGLVPRVPIDHKIIASVESGSPKSSNIYLYSCPCSFGLWILARIHISKARTFNQLFSIISWVVDVILPANICFTLIVDWLIDWFICSVVLHDRLRRLRLVSWPEWVVARLEHDEFSREKPNVFLCLPSFLIRKICWQFKNVWLCSKLQCYEFLRSLHYLLVINVAAYEI